jgi:hypothetical protein
MRWLGLPSVISYFLWICMGLLHCTNIYIYIYIYVCVCRLSLISYLLGLHDAGNTRTTILLNIRKNLSESSFFSFYCLAS